MATLQFASTLLIIFSFAFTAAIGTVFFRSHFAIKRRKDKAWDIWDWLGIAWMFFWTISGFIALIVTGMYKFWVV